MALSICTGPASGPVISGLGHQVKYGHHHLPTVESTVLPDHHYVNAHVIRPMIYVTAAIAAVFWRSIRLVVFTATRSSQNLGRCQAG